MVSAAQRAPGCLGGGIEGSPSDDRVWQITCRFADEATANAWASSSSNARWGRYMQKFAVQIEIRFSNGLTTLGESTEPSMSPVSPDSDIDIERAPQGKRRVVLAVFVFVVFFGAVISANGMAVKMLPEVPPLVRILVLCFAMTGLAAWVLPPLLHRGGGAEIEASKKTPSIGTPKTRRRAPEVNKRQKVAPEPTPTASSTRETLAPPPQQAPPRQAPPQPGRRRADRQAGAVPQQPVRAQEPRGRRGTPEPVPVRLKPLSVDPGPMIEAPQPPAPIPVPAPGTGFFPTSPHRGPGARR
jgi:antibiotic biosynthesis monooxygenase (ABM) superfamily enzyme